MCKYYEICKKPSRRKTRTTQLKYLIRNFFLLLYKKTTMNKTNGNKRFIL